jgi:hypothetical protein
MRRISIVPVLLAAVCITSAVAFAARQTATATFESLSASGVTGDATLKVMPQAETQIHVSLRGLDPSVAYVVNLFPDNQTCTTGTSSQPIESFVANPAGIANFTVKVPNPIEQIGSLSVQKQSDQSLQACAAVTQ